LTTIFSNSPRSQTLFLYGHQTPSLVETRYVQTSASGIYPERIYTGQTEPPLRLALRGGWRLGLNTTDYGLKFYMDRRADGVNFVTGGTGILTFISAIDQAGVYADAQDPVFTHTWVSGETDVSGLYNGQFRVIRKADGAPMFADLFPLRIHQSV